MKTIITFADHYCLKDGRDNFDIDEARDWELMLGSQKYKDNVDAILTESIASKRPPRLVWVGDFGVGKTHHINYAFRKILAEGLPFKAIRIELPDVVDSSLFNVLFERMTTEIGCGFFRPLLIAELESNRKWIDAVTPSDIKKALRQIDNEEVWQFAWDFLCGRKLTQKARAEVGLSKVQLNDSEEFASALKQIAHVIAAQAPEKQRLLFLVDEAEGLHAITKANAVQMWTNALRKILDLSEVGAIFAIGSLDFNSIPPIMLQGPILRRFGQQNYVMLEQYEKGETKAFLEGLFCTFVDPNKRAALEQKEKLASTSGYSSKFYPFMPDALEAYAHYLVSDTARAKPAEFLHKLHKTLDAARAEGKFVIDRAFLEQRGEWQ